MPNSGYLQKQLIYNKKEITSFAANTSIIYKYRQIQTNINFPLTNYQLIKMIVCRTGAFTAYHRCAKRMFRFAFGAEIRAVFWLL